MAFLLLKLQPAFATVISCYIRINYGLNTLIILLITGGFCLADINDQGPRVGGVQGPQMLSWVSGAL